MTRNGSTYWEFDGFRLEAGEGGRLLKGDREIHLRPRAAAVLRLLVEARGEVVTRREILEKVWLDANVEEGNINYAISRIRKKLSKHGTDGLEYIGTIPKTGYRFLPEIVEVVEGRSEPVFRPAGPATFWTRGRAVLLAMILVAFTTSFAVWWQSEREPSGSSVSLADRNIKSLVVLPPLPLAEESEKDRVLRMAIADSIGTSLMRLQAFAVRPVSSVIEFERSDQDELTFARSLDADAVLASTMLKDGGAVRLNFRLLDTRDGAVIWNDTVDLSESGVLELQESVSQLVTNRLASAMRIGSPRIAGGRLTDDPEAYELYLRGKFYLETRKPGEPSALDLFRKATKLDPEFAEAYVGIADSLAFREYPSNELGEALEKAIELDPTLAEAYATRGFVRMFNEWDWDGAEDDLLHAIEIDPNNAKARHWYGTYFTLLGQFPRAREQLNIALELNPSSPFIRKDLAELSYFQGDYDLAVSQAMDLSRMKPDFREAYWLLAKIRFALGGDEEGVNYIVKYFDRTPEFARRLKSGYEDGAMKGFAREYLPEKSCFVDEYRAIPCAEVLYLSGDREAARRYLEDAAERRLLMLVFLNVDPIWNGLREDPGFKRLISEMGLPREPRRSATD